MRNPDRLRQWLDALESPDSDTTYRLPSICSDTGASPWKAYRHKTSDLLMAMRDEAHARFNRDYEQAVRLTPQGPDYIPAEDDRREAELEPGDARDVVQRVLQETRDHDGGSSYKGQIKHQICCIHPQHDDNTAGSAWIMDDGWMHCDPCEDAGRGGVADGSWMPHETAALVGLDVDYDVEDDVERRDDVVDADDIELRSVDDIGNDDGLYFERDVSSWVTLTDDLDVDSFDVDGADVLSHPYTEVDPGDPRERPIQINTDDDLACLRAYLEDDFQTLLDSGRSCWVDASTGVGKSHTARQVVANANDMSCLYLAPTHQLLDEAASHMEEMDETVEHRQRFSEAEPRCEELSYPDPLAADVDDPSRADEIRALQDAGCSKHRVCQTCPLNPTSDVPLHDAEDDVDVEGGHCEAILQSLRMRQRDMEAATDDTDTILDAFGVDDDAKDELDDVDDDDLPAPSPHSFIPSVFLGRHLMRDLADQHDVVIIDEDPVDWWRTTTIYDPSALTVLTEPWYDDHRTIRVQTDDGDEDVRPSRLMKLVLSPDPVWGTLHGDEGDVRSLAPRVVEDVDDDHDDMVDLPDASTLVSDTLDDHIIEDEDGRLTVGLNDGLTEPVDSEASRFIQDLTDPDTDRLYHYGTVDDRRIVVRQEPDPIETETPVWVLDASAHAAEREVIEAIAGEDTIELSVPLYNGQSEVRQDPTRSWSRTRQRAYTGLDEDVLVEVAQALEDDDVPTIREYGVHRWDGWILSSWLQSVMPTVLHVLDIEVGGGLDDVRSACETLDDWIDDWIVADAVVDDLPMEDPPSVVVQWAASQGLCEYVAEGDYVGQVINQIRSMDGDVGIISHKNSPVVDRVVDACRDTLTDDERLMVGHYGGLRGLDYMGYVDHLVLLGDPSVHRDALWREAARWGLDDPDDAFRFESGYQCRHYRVSYPMLHDTRGSHLSQLVWRRVVRDEIVQAMGRSRALVDLGGTTIHAWMTPCADHPGLLYEAQTKQLQSEMRDDKKREILRTIRTTWLSEDDVIDVCDVPMGHRRQVRDWVQEMTEVRVGVMRQLIARGHSYADVADKMLTTESHVQTLVDRHGLHTEHLRRTHRREVIEAMTSQDATLEEIADRLDASVGSVHRWKNELIG